MDRPMVAIDVGPLQGPRTGVGVAVAHIVDALRDRATVRLRPYVVSFRAQLDSGVRRLPLPAAVAHRCWAHLDRPRADAWLRPADVVHGTNYVVPPARLPRIVSVYDCWFLRHGGAVHPDVRRAGEALRHAVRAGATVHTSSHATADRVRELLRTDRVRVVPLGAPQAARSPVEPPPGFAQLSGVPFVLALGTLERRKNLARLVKAFASIAASDADVRLVLAGADGDDRSGIDAAIDSVGPDDARRVVLAGRVDDGTKAWLLHHAAVLAYPSLDEGFGFPLLEAMSAGVPIVAARAGSIPEVTGTAALLVDPLDVDALADALQRVLSDSAVRADLVAAGAAQLANFTWARTAEGLTELYRDVIAEGPR